MTHRPRLLLLAFAALLLSGCAPGNYPSAVDPLALPEPSPTTADDYTEVKVRYATNRRKDAQGQLLAEINISKDALSYGQAVVLIPLKRERGSFKDAHSDFFKVLKIIGLRDERDDPLISIDSSQSRSLSSAQFFKSFKPGGAYGKGDILLFVHGFNVNFESAIKRAAQVAYDIDLNLQPVAFSWPSIGDPLKYSRDYGRALDSADDFKVFLAALAVANPDKKIHILAHSMGSKIVIPALTALYRETPKAFRSRIGNVILAAPDYPRDTFSKKDQEAFAKFGRTTIYMSADDQALKLSSNSYMADREMLGFSGPDGFYHSGIDSIDITQAVAIDDLLGHSKYGNSSRVLGDMHFMIGKDLRAAKRTGVNITPPTKYWVLQPDFIRP